MIELSYLVLALIMLGVVYFGFRVFEVRKPEIIKKVQKAYVEAQKPIEPKKKSKKVPKKKADGIITMEGAPCKNGGHTTFMIVPDDGAFAPLPRENFLMTTDIYQSEVERQIRAMGYDWKV